MTIAPAHSITAWSVSCRYNYLLVLFSALLSKQCSFFFCGSVYTGKFISPLFLCGSFFPQSILKIIFTSLLWIYLFNAKFIFTSCACFMLHKYQFRVKHEKSRHVLTVSVRGDSNFFSFTLLLYLFYFIHVSLIINFYMRSKLDMV